MYLGINIILLVLEMSMMQLAFAMTMQARFEKRKQLVLNLLLMLFTGILSYFKMQTDLKTIQNYSIQIMQIIISVSFFLSAFKDRLWKKILFWLITFVGNMATEIICNEFYYKPQFNVGKHVRDMDSVIYLKCCVFCSIVEAVILFGIVILWKSFTREKTRGTLKKVLIVILILFQVIILFRAQDRVTAYEQTNQQVEYGVIAIWAALSDFLILVMVLSEKKNLQISKDLQELEYIQKLEAAHYCAIEEKEVELAKIRHDFRNQMNVVRNLLLLSEKERAEQVLEEMEEKLQNNETREFCHNVIINSILLEKARLCEENQITLQSDIQLSEVDGIRVVHLCSVFSNLLDNAIHAAKEYDQGEKYIKIMAQQQGEYLIIQVKNSAIPKKKFLTARKGYGREILSEIAASYHGKSAYRWEGEEYQATVMLLCNIE